MYLLNREILNAFNEDSREIYVKAVFNNEYTIDGDYIKSFTITDSIGNTDALTLGNACSNKLELDMFVPEDFTGLTAAKIEMYIGIEVNGSISYVPLGVFYADNVKSTDNFKSVKITAFDAMLKLNDLGNTYRCGLSGNYVTPIEIIKDIAAQAFGRNNVTNEPNNIDIPDNPVDTIVRQAEGVLYSSTGTKYESLCSLGINTLISLPKYAQDIEIRFKGLPEDMSYSDVRVVYYNDPQGTSKYSTSTYGGMTFGDYVDWDEGDNIEVYVAGTITPPSVDRPLYLGFHIGTSTFDDVPDVRIEIDISNPYINSRNIPNPGTVDFSARTMLGYMAGLMGCNAVINRAGQLTIRRLNLASPISIPADIQFMNGFEQSLENALRIEYLTTGTETNESGAGEVITVGQGSYGFNFENPYIMTESEAQNILDLYNGLYIMPGKVRYRGNPSIDCGDLLLVEDRNGDNQNVLVLSQTLTVTGGFNSTIDCSLKTDSKQDFIATPSTKKVTQKFTDFERAYAEVISRLSGVNGGYVKNVYDNYNCIRAIAICESDIAVRWDDANGKVVVANSADNGEPMWVWSYGGLSYTPNGGTTYNVAINMQGEIYAEYIVGKLSKFVELEAELGTIAGWNINNESLYTDYGDYRAYIQKPLSNKHWIFSTQKKLSENSYEGLFYVTTDGHMTSQSLVISGNNNDGGMIGLNGDFYSPEYGMPYNPVIYIKYSDAELMDGGWTFFVRSNGDVFCRNIQFEDVILDGRGYNVISTNNDQFEIGQGSFFLNQNSYYEGGTICLNYNNGGVSIQSHTVERMSFKYTPWLFGGIDSDYVYRDTIHTSGPMVLDANNANNAMYLVASSIRLRANTYINGDTYIGFAAASGTVALAVNTNGKITVQSSSARYKENIINLTDDSLNPERLYDLPVRQYNYKDEYKDYELVSGTQIGIIAEDVDKIYPNACIYNQEGQPESWQDRIMIPAMLKLIQEQKSDIDELKAQNKELKETLESVLARLDKLEKE